MIDILWQLMTTLGKAYLGPCIALYVVFDMLGMLLFNKR